MKDMNNNIPVAMNSTVPASGIGSNHWTRNVFCGPYAPLLFATAIILVDRICKTIENVTDKDYAFTHKKGENVTSFAPKDN